MQMRTSDRIRYYAKSRFEGLSPHTMKKIRSLHHLERDNLPAYWKDAEQISAAYERLYRERLDWKNVPYAFGDMNSALAEPVLTRCRPIRGKRRDNHVLLPLTRDRNINGPMEAAREGDTPWRHKVDQAVWRGVSTGKWKTSEGRLALVTRWANADGRSIGCDVGITRFVQGRERDVALEKDYMGIPEQLRYKYILSVEGNDVASNLAWAMQSSSVVLMPKPKHETWLMQGLLKPGVHYVKVSKDFSDLPKVLDWCRKNDAKCRRISANATKWVKMFSDREKDSELAARVVRRFIRNTPIAQ